MKILIDGQTLLTPDLNRGIGTYFKNAIVNVLEQDFTNDFYINVPDERCLQSLPDWTRRKLVAIISKSYQPPPLSQEDFQTDDLSKIYSATLNNDFARLGVDLYWSPNALMDNIFLPCKESNCVFSVTIYDLAILNNQKLYAEHWPPSSIAGYNARLEILERDYDLFLHISRYTAADFRNKLRVENKKHVVTLLAANEMFAPYPFPELNSARRYLLYIGGFDPRKNMTRALEAFARLHEQYGHDGNVREVGLTLVCHAGEADRRELLNYAAKLGIGEKVQLTGFVDDQTLIALYRKARGLFFPSLFEGFGLPVLEALACGLPVATSNTSSLPEVGGEFAAYFNPYDVDAMAQALHKILLEPMDYRARFERYEYSKTFSWKTTAREILNAFEEALNGEIKDCVQP
jgi:glycosyltransferase involved in cell wall biosynthesis